MCPGVHGDAIHRNTDVPSPGCGDAGKGGVGVAISKNAGHNRRRDIHHIPADDRQIGDLPLRKGVADRCG